MNFLKIFPFFSQIRLHVAPLLPLNHLCTQVLKLDPPMHAHFSFQNTPLLIHCRVQNFLNIKINEFLAIVNTKNNLIALGRRRLPPGRRLRRRFSYFEPTYAPKSFNVNLRPHLPRKLLTHLPKIFVNLSSKFSTPTTEVRQKLVERSIHAHLSL